MRRKNGQNGILSGFIWIFMEKIASEGMAFIVTLILSRLLLPEDYGAIVVVNIFTTLANVFVTSGLGVALVQKKDADDLDFSTVFWGSLTVSLVLYIVLFFMAPYIAQMYETPILKHALRVIGLSLIISVFNNMHRSYVSKKMMFGKFFFSTIWCTVLAAIVGIVLAYMGFGVWALVAQYMANRIIRTIVLFFMVNWKPRFMFSFSRFKTLFQFGWKLLLTELINTGYLELRSLVIGLKYSTSDLALYERGRSYPKLLVNNINTSLQRVLFPAMCNVQDNKDVVKNILKKTTRVTSYIITPMVLGLAVVAEPLITVLLTEKWVPCVPYMQLYCCFYAFMPVQSGTIQVMKALGRSDIYVKLEIVKKIIGITVLFLTINYGVFAIVLGSVLANIFSALINIIPMKKLLNYSIFEQLGDYLNGILPLTAMVICCLAVKQLPINNLALVCVQVIVGIVVYLLVSLIMKNDSFFTVIELTKRLIKKRR